MKYSIAGFKSLLAVLMVHIGLTSADNFMSKNTFYFVQQSSRLEQVRFLKNSYYTCKNFYEEFFNFYFFGLITIFCPTNYLQSHGLNMNCHRFSLLSLWDMFLPTHTMIILCVCVCISIIKSTSQ